LVRAITRGEREDGNCQNPAHERMKGGRLGGGREWATAKGSFGGEKFPRPRLMCRRKGASPGDRRPRGQAQRKANKKIRAMKLDKTKRDSNPRSNKKEVI